MTLPVDQAFTVPNRLKRLLRLFGALVGLAATSYFLVVVYRTLTLEDARPLLTVGMVRVISLSAIIYALVVPTTGWAWGRLLRGVGVPVPTLQLNMIIGITQIAKYLPGNIGQHLGRFAMAVQRGVPPGVVLVTLAAETLLVIGAAVGVSTIALTIVRPDAPTHLLAQSSSLFLAALGAGVVLALLVAMRRPLARLAVRLLPALAPHVPIQVPRPGSLSAASGAYVLNYCLGGAALYYITSSATGVPPPPLLFCIGVFAVSWVTGFVVPGAPAGLGVREGVMVALLTPALDAATAIQVVIAFRIVTTLGDVLGLVWGASILLAATRKEPT